jgi:hypothetical protein
LDVNKFVERALSAQIRGHRRSGKKSGYGPYSASARGVVEQMGLPVTMSTCAAIECANNPESPAFACVSIVERLWEQYQQEAKMIEALDHDDSG